jgi:hypothetical protein
MAQYLTVAHEFDKAVHHGELRTDELNALLIRWATNGWKVVQMNTVVINTGESLRTLSSVKVVTLILFVKE